MSQIEYREIVINPSLKCARILLNSLQPIIPINGQIFTFKQNAAIGEHIIIESVKEIKQPDIKIQLKDLKTFLAENNGIKLYRSKYRIGYLGNKESDWIKLQQFRTKGQQWYRFDLGNTIGYVLFLVNGARPYGRFAASSNGFSSGGSGVGVTLPAAASCSRLFTSSAPARTFISFMRPDFVKEKNSFVQLANSKDYRHFENNAGNR